LHLAEKHGLRLSPKECFTRIDEFTEKTNMKNSKKYQILIQAALMSFVLAGCSSFKTTKEPSVRDTIAEVIAASEMSDEDNTAKEPSLTLTGRSPDNSNYRSNSVWMSVTTVTEPAAQGRASQASDRLDKKSTRQSQLSKRTRSRPEGPKAASQSRQTASVDDTLKMVLSGRNTTGESTVMDALLQVIPATQTADDDADEDSSTK
jgi:hypothetical protein